MLSRRERGCCGDRRGEDGEAAMAVTAPAAVMTPPQTDVERSTPAMENREVWKRRRRRREVEQETASFTHAQPSKHDGANLCRPGRQTKGEGNRRSAFTETADQRVTSSVKQRNNSCVMKGFNQDRNMPSSSFTSKNTDYAALPPCGLT